MEQILEDPLKLYETVSAEALTLASIPSPTFPGFKITPPQFRLEFVPRVLKVQECQQCTSRHPGTKAWRGSERQLKNCRGSYSAAVGRMPYCQGLLDQLFHRHGNSDIEAPPVCSTSL